jgi:Cytochrome bd terminal oxidase subunit I
VPGVLPLFWSFRIMVALGFYFIFLFAAAFWFTSKLDFSQRWLLRLFVWSLPLPWLSAELGWFVAPTTLGDRWRITHVPGLIVRFGGAGPVHALGLRSLLFIAAGRRCDADAPLRAHGARRGSRKTHRAGKTRDSIVKEDRSCTSLSTMKSSG